MIRIVARENPEVVGHYAPDLNRYDDNWWCDLPIPPVSRISPEDVPTFIKQIDEPEGGKQSCDLTSQLNALILRGEVTTDQAMEIQATLATDEKYAKFWWDTADRKYKGWTAQVRTLAFLMPELLGRRIGLDYVDVGEYSIKNARKCLMGGYALVLIGNSKMGPHARLGYMSDDQDDSFRVFDPKYDEASGAYPMTDFQTLHITRNLLVY